MGLTPHLGTCGAGRSLRPSPTPRLSVTRPSALRWPCTIASPQSARQRAWRANHALDHRRHVYHSAGFNASSRSQLRQLVSCFRPRLAHMPSCRCSRVNFILELLRDRSDRRGFSRLHYHYHRACCCPDQARCTIAATPCNVPRGIVLPGEEHTRLVLDSEPSVLSK